MAHKTIHEENTLFNGDNLEIRNGTHTKLFTRMTMVLLESLVSQTSIGIGTIFSVLWYSQVT